MADQNQQPMADAVPEDIQQDQIPADVPLPSVSSQPSITGQADATGGSQSRPINTGAPKHAADADLIEKEWVIKAKQIVEHTKDNPYEQQKALGKFKADYMKKRYNKDIKTSDA